MLYMKTDGIMHFKMIEIAFKGLNRKVDPHPKKERHQISGIHEIEI